MMLHYPTKKSKLLIVLLFLVFFSSIGYSAIYEHFVSDYTPDLDDDWINWGNVSAIDLLNATSQNPVDDGYTGNWTNATAVSNLGTINSVHVAVRFATLGGSGSDWFRFDYGNASTAGDCSTVTGFINITGPIDTTTTITYYNITNSSLTWTDLDNICFSPWYEKVGGDDNIESEFDAAWIKVDYTGVGPPNTAPNITTPTIIPATVYANDTMNCSVVASDDENVTLYINFTWYEDGSIQNAYNYLQTCSNSTICYTGIFVPNTTTSEGEGWNCTAQAWDAIPPAGLNSNWNNTYVVIQNITTNNVTVFVTPDPVNVTLDAKFQANYTDKNDNPIVNVSVCNIDFQIGAGGWVGAVWMAWNGTSEMYEHTRSFPNVEVVNVSTVCLEGNYTEQRNMTNITVQLGPDVYPPQITWEDPTPDPDETITQDFVILNTTITDDNQTSAFFDWNRSLVVYLPFDYYNSTHILDNSSYGNNGSFNGADFGTDNITKAQYGDGLKFGGDDDYIEVFNDSSLNINDTITLEAWIYPRDNSYQHRFIYKQYAYVFRVFNTNVNCYQYNSSGGFNASYAVSYGISANTWYHVVCTIDTTLGINETKLYVNGILRQTRSTDFSINTSSTNLYISSGATGTYIFNGTLDEVRIHNRILSPEEVNASYNNSQYRLFRNISNLANGVYNYSACAIDGVGNLNCTVDRNVTVNVVEAANLTFTTETVNASNENYSIETFPGNETLDIWFNVTSSNQKYVTPCIETGSPPSAECQNLTNPIMRFKNVGSTSFNISIRLNESLIGNITVFANFSNYTSMADCAGWSLASNNTIINITSLIFTRAMCVSNVTDVWLYANFTDYLGGIVYNVFNYSSGNT